MPAPISCPAITLRSSGSRVNDQHIMRCFHRKHVSGVDIYGRVGLRSACVAKPKGLFYEQLGRALATARRGQRLTQDRLAAAVSLSRTSITNIEKGRQLVPVHVLVKLAQTLNVAISDLVPSPESDVRSARVE